MDTDRKVGICVGYFSLYHLRPLLPLWQPQMAIQAVLRFRLFVGG